MKVASSKAGDLAPRDLDAIKEEIQRFREDARWACAPVKLVDEINSRPGVALVPCEEKVIDVKDGSFLEEIHLNPYAVMFIKMELQREGE